MTAVVLRNWWLVKAEKAINGKQIAVAGFSNREMEGNQLFISEPIVKRCDAFTLETANGTSIKLEGFIDTGRTKENGFSSEIPQRFVYGFPLYWEDYVNKCCLSEEPKTELLVRNVDNQDFQIHLPVYPSPSTPVPDTVPIVSPETATTSGIEAAAPPEVEHETAYEDIVPRCLVSSNIDKDQNLSVETKQHDGQGEATAKLKPQKRRKDSAQELSNSKSMRNDLTSAKSKTVATANVKLSGREVEKKSLHLNQSTLVHDSFRRSRSGRLLLPPLEYWRNQRVVFNKDGKISGVMGILDNEHLHKGSKSEPPKKRRNLQ